MRQYIVRRLKRIKFNVLSIHDGQTDVIITKTADRSSRPNNRLMIYVLFM